MKDTRMRTKNYSIVVYKYGSFSEKKIEALYNELPAARRTRIENITNNPIYREFLIVEYFIVIKKLKLKNAGDFSYNEMGKPFFENAKLHFSISHSNEILIVAFSKSNIGVDIQFPLPFQNDVAHLVCNDDEFHLIANSKNPDLEFTKLWTKKESIVKFYGGTLYQDTKNILINYSDLKVLTKTKKGYVMSICLKG